MITDLTAQDLRDFEQTVAEHFNAGRIRAPIHLSGGCEDETIRVFKNIRERDWIATNWRSHWHCLLKGVPRDQLLVDILAGKSITLTYPSHRIISSAIVGGILPIALGIALSIKRRGGSERVHVFSGDMTARTGIFHECVQYANGHSLPIRFIVEDNGKSVCSDTAETWGTDGCGIDFARFSYSPQWPHSGTGQWVQWT